MVWRVWEILPRILSFIPAKVYLLAALEVLYLQAEVPDQVEVNEGNWGDGQLLAGEHGEGPALDGKDVFFHLGGVLLTGGYKYLGRLLCRDLHFYFDFDSVFLTLILKL